MARVGGCGSWERIVNRNANLEVTTMNMSESDDIKVLNLDLECDSE